MSNTRLHPPKTAMEVFRTLPEGTLCEVINNTIYMSPGASYEHQRIKRKLMRKLDQFVDENNLGEVFDAPMDVFLDDKNVFQPDIFFISNMNTGKLIPGGGFEGIPDLVIEILSFNKKHDLITKKQVYERLGVKEYWVVDPLTFDTLGITLKHKLYVQLPKSHERIKSVLLRKTFPL